MFLHEPMNIMAQLRTIYKKTHDEVIQFRTCVVYLFLLISLEVPHKIELPIKYNVMFNYNKQVQ